MGWKSLFLSLIRRQPSKLIFLSLKTNFPPLNTATYTSENIFMWRLKSLYGKLQ